MSTYERVAKLCKRNKLAITALEKELGFGRGTIGKWKKGAEPNLANLQKVADYFNVSVDYLTTYEIKPNVEFIKLNDVARRPI